MNKTIVIHVQSGETLYGIAARHGVSVDALQRWNDIDNPDLVLVGQRIVIYTSGDAPESLASESAVPVPAPVPDAVSGTWGLWIGCAIVLGLLLLLLRRKRRAATRLSRASSPHQPRHPIAGDHGDRIRRPKLLPEPAPTPQTNAGERLVGLELARHYRDWMLINDVLLPSGAGTTQIDHVLVSPNSVFVIETKELNGWIFGGPGQRQWTQSFAAGHWSRKLGITSKQFKFYNPLLQNEGHAKSLVKLDIVNSRRLRPIVAFVGDAQLKTAECFLPFDEHERIACKNRIWRMRGVVCMSLADLHRYIRFSVSTSSECYWTRQNMEQVCAKIREAEIPMTAEAHARHVSFVRSVKEMRLR